MRIRYLIYIDKRKQLNPFKIMTFIKIQELRSIAYKFALILSGKEITNSKELKAAFPEFAKFDLRRKDSWKWVVKSLERKMNKACYVPAV